MLRKMINDILLVLEIIKINFEILLLNFQISLRKFFFLWIRVSGNW